MLTDRRRDLTDFRTLLETMLARVDWSRDLIVVSQTAQDSLDYTGPKAHHGSKAMLLGLGSRSARSPSGGSTDRRCRGRRPRARYCRGCLVAEGAPYVREKDQAARVAKFEGFREWPLVVLVDDLGEATASTELFLWTTFTRMEPAADIHGREQKVARFHVGLEPPVVWDCRMKPWYPEVMEVDEPTRLLVDRRWRVRGLKGRQAEIRLTPLHGPSVRSCARDAGRRPSDWGPFSCARRPTSRPRLPSSS